MNVDVAIVEDQGSTLAWNIAELSLRHPLEFQPPRDLGALLGANGELPPLPETTRQLLRLQQDPNADARQLGKIVELDPLLAAQMLRWANSAFYGLRREVTSVRDAIVAALGFDTALSLALGLTTLTPLRAAKRGPLGRDAVWRHGLLSAALIRRLASALPKARRPSHGLAQMAGLTQNIGYLVLGHLLPETFAFLNRLVAQNPRLELTTIERFALGADHTQLGLWLFETWGMPECLLATVRHHHHPDYRGEHQDLVLLTSLADRLLGRSTWGMGASETETALTYPACATLGIDGETANAALAGALLALGAPDNAG